MLVHSGRTPRQDPALGISFTLIGAASAVYSTLHQDRAVDARPGGVSGRVWHRMGSTGELAGRGAFGAATTAALLIGRLA